MAADRPRMKSTDKPAPELGSPACSMHEADDVYMGYAGKDEIVGLLNELLEAERTCARVARSHEAAIALTAESVGPAR